MARRGDFERVVLAMAREVARQQRLNAAAEQKRLRDEERARKEQARDAERASRLNWQYAKDAARAAKLEHIESRELEALNMADAVAAEINGLSNLLNDTLCVDDSIDFDRLRIRESAPRFVAPIEISKAKFQPRRDDFLCAVQPLGWFSKMIPALKRDHASRLAKADESFRAEMAKWESEENARLAKVEEAKKAHSDIVAAIHSKVAQRDREVDEFKKGYFEADVDAVIAYNTMVLERSQYPESFPQNFSVAYTPASMQLVVEYELPLFDVVPKFTEFKYLKAKDEIEGKARKITDIKDLYQDVVSAIALRTIHEVFEADKAKAIDVCCFNGYVNTIDPATGVDIQPHLISVRTTKETFLAINLARVEKKTCLRNLGAQVSRHAAEAQPVKPIVEFDMVDSRFVDQADLVSGLGAAPNLMDLNPYEFEHLVANLFGKMGLESKLTRSSRDGGVDCVAYDARPVLGGKVVIQAKRYRHTVGVSAVRDLYGTMMNEGANKGILVTTSGYGPDAFDFASDKPIELIDGGSLLYLLQDIGMQARIIFPREN